MNIEDLNLSDVETLKRILENMEAIDLLAPEYGKVRDLRVDVSTKIRRANLSELEKGVITEKLIRNKTHKEVRNKFRMGHRWQKRVIHEAIEKIARS